MHTDMHPSHYVQTYGFNFATVLAHRDALGRQVVLVKLGTNILTCCLLILQTYSKLLPNMNVIIQYAYSRELGSC